MKNFWTTYKYRIISATWLLLGIAFVVFLRQSSKEVNKQLCTSIGITIDRTQGNLFVDERDIERMVLSQLPNNRLNVSIGEVSVQEIEQYLEANPYIENAEVYIDIKGKMWITVAQQYPLLRVVSQTNNNFYLNKEGEKMPASSDFASRVPVATGHIVDNGQNTGKIEESQIQDLFELATFLHNDPFWRPLIEQVYIAKNQDIILIPKVGQHEIIVGSIANLDQKMQKLRNFYQDGLAITGWDKYRAINVKYKNQVVGIKR